MGRIHEDHATSPVHPGVSQHESGSSQSAQPGDKVGMDATPGGSPRSSPPVAGDHRPIRDFADNKAPSVLCSSVGTQGSGGRCIPPALGQPPGICLPSYSHHKESSSQTESLSQLLLKLRASHNCDLTSDRPLLASKGMVSRSTRTSIRHSIELPKRRDLLRQPHFHRFHENLPMLCLTAWRLSSNSPVRRASLKQWLANLPSVGENLLD